MHKRCLDSFISKNEGYIIIGYKLYIKSKQLIHIKIHLLLYQNKKNTNFTCVQDSLNVCIKYVFVKINNYKIVDT